MLKFVYVFLHILLCIPLLTEAQYTDTIQIGLFRNSPSSQLLISPVKTNYFIYNDSSIIYLQANQHYKIENLNGKMQLWSLQHKILTCDTIILVTNDTLSEIKLRQSAQSKEKTYRGSFIFIPEDKNIKIINRINLEQYIACVMESEAGYGHHIEYYKAQAVISRTYALNNLKKHEPEGFNLCDQVHCQAYKGSRKFEPNLTLAAEQTAGVVIVDDSLKFITATYHSNCGGQTASSEQVWNKALPYLRSVKDPFCISQPNAYWKKEISISDWLNYLAKNKFPIHDSICITNCTTYTQNYRNTYLSSCNINVHLRAIRESLNLKSTYFSIEPLNETTLVLKGRGFGHGVGLCQEGAMKMASLGYDYKSILKHYFTGVYILDIQSLYRLAEER